MKWNETVVLDRRQSEGFEALPLRDLFTTSLIAKEARTHGWEIASRNVLPNLATINTPGGGVTNAEIRDMIIILDAMPRYAHANRVALQLEADTDAPASITWTDAETGATFRYHGEATQFAPARV